MRLSWDRILLALAPAILIADSSRADTCAPASVNFELALVARTEDGVSVSVESVPAVRLTASSAPELITVGVGVFGRFETTATPRCPAKPPTRGDPCGNEAFACRLPSAGAGCVVFCDGQWNPYACKSP